MTKLVHPSFDRKELPDIRTEFAAGTLLGTVIANAPAFGATLVGGAKYIADTVTTGAGNSSLALSGLTAVVASLALCGAAIATGSRHENKKSYPNAVKLGAAFGAAAPLMAGLLVHANTSEPQTIAEKPIKAETVEVKIDHKNNDLQARLDQLDSKVKFILA